MKNRWTKAVRVAGIVAVAYIGGPIVAGALDVGLREGPVLYPTGFHIGLYITGSEMAGRGKPREPPDGWMYERPLFYGLPRRLKPRADRQAYIEMATRNRSPRLDLLLRLNAQVEGEQAAGADGTPPAQP